MKRLIAAVSFAAFTVPSIAAEYGNPFEQLDLDRALPQVNIPAVESRSVDTHSLPYEQAQVAERARRFDRPLQPRDRAVGERPQLRRAAVTS